jgi:PKD repeat protein
MRLTWRAAAVAMLGCALCPVVAAPTTADAAAAVTAVPRPDHVVVVVEENKSTQAIIGNPNAPYLNSLAATGANMTSFFAETHPSQPNYLALFSGSTQGVTNDSCPLSFGGANLGSVAIAAGVGFVGYSESLPSVGYTGCTSGKYARKHNPWVDFTNLPASVNRPFTDFPSDYSQLPGVSFVMPNLDNDMHDGSIAQGDAWLQSNLGGSADWARTHNSLLVVTFDEDDFRQSNQIATVIVGQQVQAGDYSEPANHYNLLRTIEDGLGLPALGASATADPLLDIWRAPDGDQLPVAAFTSSCTGLSCAFDGSGSSDPDGSVASYAWSFGDATSGTGVSPTHVYGAGGPQSVTLTVTDNQGASSSVTHVVSPVAPAGTPFVSDGFNRTVRGGWGSAEVGGAWSTVGTSTQFSVNPGGGVLALSKAGAQLEGYVGPSRSDADVTEVLSASVVPVGGPLYLTVAGRRVSAGNAYSAKVLVNANGSVTLRLSGTAGGVDKTLAGAVTVPGLTYTAGTSLSARVQVFGTSPTTVRAKVWRTNQTEPSTWQLSATDSQAALQTGGTVGLTAYLSSAATNPPVSVMVTSFAARPMGG